jgi:hypothetical protein
MDEGHEAMILTSANPKNENGFGRNAVKQRKSALIVAVTDIARKRVTSRAEPADGMIQRYLMILAQAWRWFGSIVTPLPAS